MGNSSFADAAAFRNAAVTGQVGVDPDAAQAVLNKLRAGKDTVENLLLDAGHSLSHRPQLGSNEVAEAMSEKVSERAAGGERDSYAQALRNLYQQYDQAERAITTAMSRYEEIDEASADPFLGRA